MKWQKTLSNGDKQYATARNNMQLPETLSNGNGQKQYHAATARNNMQQPETI